MKILVISILSRPGAYAHDVPVGRHTEFDESFGSRKTLKNSITVKCTKGIPDKVYSCIAC